MTSVGLGAPLSVEHQIGGACPGTTLLVTVHNMVRVLSGKRGVPGIGQLTPSGASLQSSLPSQPRHCSGDNEGCWWCAQILN